MSARWSTERCPAPQAIWRTGCTGRRPRALTRSSCTSTAGVGFWAMPFRTIRCAGTFGAKRRDSHLGGLPARARAPVPCRGRRRHGRGAVGRGQCRGTRRHTGPARGLWLERGRWARGGGLPARARHGRTEHHRAGLVDALNRRRHGTRIVHRQCGGLRFDDGACPLVVRPLHRHR